MTSLSEQLRRLALPDAKLGEELTKRPSLLFDSHKAATLDREAFYALGVNGFEELCSIDQTLYVEFYDTLFSETSKNTERSILTKDDNKKLDSQIRNFLLRVMPYFLMRPAQKCLEWMIYRFRIHCFNVDDILQSFLPYHETKMFVRLVQLLDISHPTNKWCWIAPIQKPGVSLMRATISNHCVIDSAFFYFICDSVSKAIKANSQVSSSANVLRPIINFYTAVTLETIHKISKISDQFLAQLVPFIIKGLKSNITDYKSATYMIICQVCSKAILTEQVASSLLKSASKHHTGKLYEEFLTTVVVICQSQEKMKALPKLCVQKLCEIHNLSELLEEFSKTKGIEKFLKIFFESLIPAAFNQKDSYSVPDSSEIDEIEDPDEISTDFSKILMKFVKNFPMSKNIQKLFTRLSVEEFMRQDTESVSFSEIIKQIQRKYPEEFDSAISNLSRKSSPGNFPECINKFISISAETAKHQLVVDGETSLMLGLCYPEATVRASAVENLQNMLKFKSELVKSDFVRQSVKHRLEIDDSPVVVLKVLELIHAHTETFFYDLDTASSILVKLVLKNRRLPEWDNVLLAAITLLCSKLFESCSDQCKSYINILLYDIILREICLNEESSTYNIAIRGSFMEKNSKLLFPITPGMTIDGVLSKMKNALETDVELLSTTWNASREISHFLQDNPDETRAKLKLPSYFVFSYITISMSQPQNHGALNTCQKMMFEILEDLKSFVTSFKDLKQSEEPRKKMQKRDESIKSFNENLSNLVVGFYNCQTHTTYTLCEIDLLCSLLVEIFKMLNRIGSCQEKGSKFDQWGVGSNNGSSMEMDNNVFCWNAKRAIYSTLSDLISVVEFGVFENVNLISVVKNLMQIFITDVFSNSDDFVSFLSPYWTGYFNGRKTGAVAQISALYIGNSMLRSKIKKQVLETSIPNLLVCLSSEIASVRKASLICIKTCSELSTSFQELLRHLAEHKDEIESDSSAVIEVFDTFFSAEKTSAGNKRSSRKRTTILDGLLKHYLCCDDIPTKVRTVLLKSLKKVKSQNMCLLLVPVIHKQLETMKNRNLEMEKDDTTLEEQDEFISPDDSFLYESILKTDAEFLDHEDIQSVFFRLISCDQKLSLGSEVMSPQSISLGLINRTFAANLGAEVQQKLLSHVLDIGSKSSNPLTISSISKAFKSISLDAEHAVEEFSKILHPTKGSLDNTSEIKSKKLKTTKNLQNLNTELTLDTPTSGIWKRTTLLLELLQNKKKIFNSEMLFPSLFGLLEFLVEVSKDQNESGDAIEGFEYIKQLLLTTMLNIFQKLKSRILKDDKMNHFISTECRIEIVVHCIQLSENSQTQQQALLLLSDVASIFPDKVLHNAMSIFTFMGSHIIKQDDEYSFQVLSMTIRSILPALVKSGEDNNNAILGKEETVLKIIRVFVDALVHIPNHRKLTVFHEILSTLGDADYLWVLIVLLVSQFSCKPVVAGSTDQDDVTSWDVGTDDDVSPLQVAMETWCSIVQFSSDQVQIASFISCLDYITTLPNESTPSHRRSVQRMMKPTMKNVEILMVRLFSTNQLRRMKLTLLAFFTHFLEQNREGFVKHFARLEDKSQQDQEMTDEFETSENNTEISSLFRYFFERLLHVIHISDSSNKSLVSKSIDSKTAKFLKVLTHKAYDVVHKINFLLPLHTFLLIIEELLGNESISTQRKALELLAERIGAIVDELPPNETLAVIKLGKELVNISKTSDDVEKTQSQEKNLLRYSSLITLKLVIRVSGKQNQIVFTDILPDLGNIVNNKLEDNQILSATFLCLAELCANLKAYCISHLGCFVPALLQLTCSTRALQNDMLLFSCVTVLHRLLENLHNFVSPHLDTILVRVTSLLLLKKYNIEKENAENNSNNNMTVKIGTRLKIITNILSTKISSRVLIPAINKCRKKNEKKRPACIIPLCKIIQKHVASLDKEKINQNCMSLMKIFMELLDIHEDNEIKLNYDETIDIKNHVINALIAMMLKLSENSFRPLFFKLFDWACLSENLPDRLLTYYMLMSELSSKMKGLFTLFAGHLMNNIAETLKNAALLNDSEIFPIQDSLTGIKRIALLGCLCDTLHNTLKYDTTGFLNRERFELILHPLVNQLNNVAVINEHIDEDQLDTLLKNHVIPCLGQVAASVTDDICWKPFNYQILLKSRHESLKVRCASLNAIQVVAEKLGEDYMTLLPESVPFLAELMEDEEEIVEKKCQDVVRNLEKILGEPLQKYF
ncbi:HEAT repeat-containing protein 1-like [Styela clava]